MANIASKYKNKNQLLDRFNSGDISAFEEIYNLFYKELYLYSLSLYKNESIDSDDIVQDAFVYILEKREIKFSSLTKIKSYLIVLIKNQFYSYCRHKVVQDKYNVEQQSNDNNYTLKAIEAEFVSIIPEIVSMVPRNCAETIKLMLEGYSIPEISKILNKPKTTIYSQRERAISVLNKHLNNNKLVYIIMMLSK